MELALPLSVNKQLRSFTDRIHHVAMFPKRVENNKTKFITRPKLANTRIKSPPNKNYQHKSSVFTWETQDILPKDFDRANNLASSRAGLWNLGNPTELQLTSSCRVRDTCVLIARPYRLGLIITKTIAILFIKCWNFLAIKRCKRRY